MKTGWIVCLLISASMIVGCASSNPPVPIASAVGSDAPVAQPQVGYTNQAQAAALWEARYGKRSEFPIGPGDILEISVPGLEELTKRTARVDEDGNISLPLLGKLHVGGLSEETVRTELIERVSQYMYHPQVDLFISAFSSRQVGVLGEVRNPAMYPLNGPADTIQKMLQRAGGMSDKAAEEIVFTPSSADTAGTKAAGSPSLATDGAVLMPSNSGDHPVPGSAQLPNEITPGHGGSTSPIVISVAAGSRDQKYLELPVMPGDTIYVPRGGDVSVVGWVYTPKVIPVTPGLTVLSVVSAAGGPLFAGDMTSVKVFRQAASGQVTVLNTDLDAVKKRAASDIPVQANDVVEVSYSTARIPGYALYYMMQGIVTIAPAAAIVAGVP